MFLELVILALAIFLAYYIFLEFPSNNLPPGPRPWPVIGNLNLLSKNLHLDLTVLGTKYGNIFRIFVGHKPIIILSGDAIKEALTGQPSDFAGRPLITASGIDFYEANPQGPGVVLMDYGPRWKLYRKLGHSAIKVYGTDRLQENIFNEVGELCKRLDVLDGTPIDIAKQFGMAVTNIICTKIFGSRYEINDPEFLKLYEMHNTATRVTAVASSSIVDVVPALSFLRHIIPKTSFQKEFLHLLHWRYSLLREKYLEHVKTFNPENIRDYTDALLKAKKAAEDEDKSTKEHFGEGTIVQGGLAPLFLAGSETTTTTLTWAVIYLLHNPDVQERLYKEIVQKIGPDLAPQLIQKKELPALEAFITETQRMANLLPLSVPHKTTKDTTILGYHIPKGVTVMANLWSLHYDPCRWEDPFKFNIDRFLGADGKFQSPPGGSFLPFGAGPRVCLGEVLARSELFLFLSRLLQQFKFKNPPRCELPSLDGEPGVVMHPSDFTVCVQRRC